jgi:hypothetical protein
MATGNNYQRVGTASNAVAGREFQNAVRGYFKKDGVLLEPNVKVPVGPRNKPRLFSLGGTEPLMLVMCKSLKWTGTGIPSGKMKALNDVMALFEACDPRYRRVLFMLKDGREGESLARYYVRTRGNAIGPNIEVWDFDPDAKSAEKVL